MPISAVTNLECKLAEVGAVFEWWLDRITHIFQTEAMWPVDITQSANGWLTALPVRFRKDQSYFKEFRNDRSWHSRTNRTVAKIIRCVNVQTTKTTLTSHSRRIIQWQQHIRAADICMLPPNQHYRLLLAAREDGRASFGLR